MASAMFADGGYGRSLVVAGTVGVGFWAAQQIFCLTQNWLYSRSRCLIDPRNYCEQWLVDREVSCPDILQRREAIWRASIIAPGSVHYKTLIWVQPGSVYRGEMEIKFSLNSDTGEETTGLLHSSRALGSRKAVGIFVDFSGTVIHCLTVNGHYVGQDGVLGPSAVPNVAAHRAPRIASVASLFSVLTTPSNDWGAVVPGGVKWSGHKIYIDRSVLKSGLSQSNKIYISFTNRYDKLPGVGLHHFKEPGDDGAHWWTNCGEFEAHRIFPCFDQPDIKGTWSLKVAAPAGAVVIAPSSLAEVRSHSGAPQAHPVTNRHLWSLSPRDAQSLSGVNQNKDDEATNPPYLRSAHRPVNGTGLHGKGGVSNIRTRRQCTPDYQGPVTPMKAYQSHNLPLGVQLGDFSFSPRSEVTVAVDLDEKPRSLQQKEKTLDSLRAAPDFGSRMHLAANPPPPPPSLSQEIPKGVFKLWTFRETVPLAPPSMGFVVGPFNYTEYRVSLTYTPTPGQDHCLCPNENESDTAPRLPDKFGSGLIVQDGQSNKGETSGDLCPKCLNPKRQDKTKPQSNTVHQRGRDMDFGGVNEGQLSEKKWSTINKKTKQLKRSQGQGKLIHSTPHQVQWGADGAVSADEGSEMHSFKASYTNQTRSVKVTVYSRRRFTTTGRYSVLVDILRDAINFYENFFSAQLPFPELNTVIFPAGLFSFDCHPFAGLLYISEAALQFMGPPREISALATVHMSHPGFESSRPSVLSTTEGNNMSRGGLNLHGVEGHLDDSTVIQSMSCIYEAVCEIWTLCYVSPRWWADMWYSQAIALHLTTVALSMPQRDRYLHQFLTESTLGEEREYNKVENGSGASSNSIIVRWFHCALKSWAYRQDMKATRHPLCCSVPATSSLPPHAVLTSVKGASIVRQLAVIMGEERLRRGLSVTMKEKPFGVTNVQELISILNKAVSEGMVVPSTPPPSPIKLPSNETRLLPFKEASSELVEQSDFFDHFPPVHGQAAFNEGNQTARSGVRVVSGSAQWVNSWLAGSGCSVLRVHWKCGHHPFGNAKKLEHPGVTTQMCVTEMTITQRAPHSSVEGIESTDLRLAERDGQATFSPPKQHGEGDLKEDITLTNRPHTLRIDLFYEERKDGSFENEETAEGIDRPEIVMRSVWVNTEGKSTTVHHVVGMPPPCAVLCNGGDFCYVMCEMDEISFKFMKHRLNDVPSPMARQLFWTSLWSMVLDRKVGYLTFVSMFVRLAKLEKDPLLLDFIIECLLVGLMNFVPDGIFVSVADCLFQFSWVSALDTIKDDATPPLASTHGRRWSDLCVRTAHSATAVETLLSMVRFPCKLMTRLRNALRTSTLPVESTTPRSTRDAKRATGSMSLGNQQGQSEGANTRSQNRWKMTALQRWTTIEKFCSIVDDAHISSKISLIRCEQRRHARDLQYSISALHEPLAGSHDSLHMSDYVENEAHIPPIWFECDEGLPPSLRMNGYNERLSIRGAQCLSACPSVELKAHFWNTLVESVANYEGAELHAALAITSKLNQRVVQQSSSMAYLAELFLRNVMQIYKTSQNIVPVVWWQRLFPCHLPHPEIISKVRNLLEQISVNSNPINPVNGDVELKRLTLEGLDDLRRARLCRQLAQKEAEETFTLKEVYELC
eukprot:GHVN01001434.1.p1 GENE.GHVN01001434.1~~GHVN01001434.1.p1  ORF type:complete len:1636 (-),score=176.13 GHVN01001434.1:2377-7284(-)